MLALLEPESARAVESELYDRLATHVACKALNTRVGCNKRLLGRVFGRLGRRVAGSAVTCVACGMHNSKAPLLPSHTPCCTRRALSTLRKVYTLALRVGLTAVTCCTSAAVPWFSTPKVDPEAATDPFAC